MECSYCGFDLDPHEQVARGGGRMLCDICVGRLGAHLDPVLDHLSDLAMVTA